MDDRLRPRPRRDKMIFTGFTKEEIEKMEKLYNESSQEDLNEDLYKNIARRFCCSSGRAGKPIVKWNQVQTWFETRKQHCDDCAKEEKTVLDITELEFEARSSKDGAWYDVDMFMAHRFLSTGEPEARVRYLGFGAEEDEWVDIKRAVRERSIALEPNECHKVKVGDLVLCFQERRDGASHFDARVLEIQKRMHDIRGCRCVFLIRYDHDDSQERVLLKRLCRRPTH